MKHLNVAHQSGVLVVVETESAQMGPAQKIALGKWLQGDVSRGHSVPKTILEWGFYLFPSWPSRSRDFTNWSRLYEQMDEKIHHWKSYWSTSIKLQLCTVDYYELSWAAEKQQGEIEANAWVRERQRGPFGGWPKLLRDHEGTMLQSPRRYIVAKERGERFSIECDPMIDAPPYRSPRERIQRSSYSEFWT